jgi:hypothetical protein
MLTAMRNPNSIRFHCKKTAYLMKNCVKELTWKKENVEVNKE